MVKFILSKSKQAVLNINEFISPEAADAYSSSGNIKIHKTGELDLQDGYFIDGMVFWGTVGVEIAISPIILPASSSVKLYNVSLKFSITGKTQSQNDNSIGAKNLYVQPELKFIAAMQQGKLVYLPELEFRGKQVVENMSMLIQDLEYKSQSFQGLVYLDPGYAVSYESNKGSICGVVHLVMYVNKVPPNGTQIYINPSEKSIKLPNQIGYSPAFVAYYPYKSQSLEPEIVVAEESKELKKTPKVVKLIINKDGIIDNIWEILQASTWESHCFEALVDVEESDCVPVTHSHYGYGRLMVRIFAPTFTSVQSKSGYETHFSCTFWETQGTLRVGADQGKLETSVESIVGCAVTLKYHELHPVIVFTSIGEIKDITKLIEWSKVTGTIKAFLPACFAVSESHETSHYCGWVKLHIEKLTNGEYQVFICPTKGSIKVKSTSVSVYKNTYYVKPKVTTVKEPQKIIPTIKLSSDKKSIDNIFELLDHGRKLTAASDDYEVFANLKEEDAVCTTNPAQKIWGLVRCSLYVTKSTTYNKIVGQAVNVHFYKTEKSEFIELRDNHLNMKLQPSELEKYKLEYKAKGFAMKLPFLNKAV